MIGVGAVVLIALGYLAWAQWGGALKTLCFGTDGACQVDLGGTDADTLFHDADLSGFEGEVTKDTVAGTTTAVVQTEDTASSTPTVPPREQGVLTGQVTVGPICPVEREGVPCVVPPEVYTSRSLEVVAAPPVRGALATAIALRGDGTFSVVLPVGTYTLTQTPSGIDSSNTLPLTVTIEAGATTTVAVDIDTGIR
jgi:hypothetical protein